MKVLKNLTVHQKIASAILKKNIEGNILNRQEIIKIVREEYSDTEIPISSIIPSDLCENKKNEDPQSGIHHVFHYEDRNKYKVLPENTIRIKCEL